MDFLSLLRTLGGLGVVLGMLAGALWVVRRYDLRLPGRAIGVNDRRLELVETLPIDGRRMAVLLRRDGREHLVLIAPEGHLILETGLIPDAVDHAAADKRSVARETATLARTEQRQLAAQVASESFAVLVDRVRVRAAPATVAFKAVLDRAVQATAPLLTPREPAPPLPPLTDGADAPIAKPVRKRRTPRVEIPDA